MHNFKMKQTVFSLMLFALLPFISSAQGEREGGPCIYETTIYPATIITIIEVYEGWNDITFVVKNRSLPTLSPGAMSLVAIFQPKN